MPPMVRLFGELATSGHSSGASGRRHSLRRGSEVGERLEHTIHLTSHSSTPSAHEGGGGDGGPQITSKYLTSSTNTSKYLSSSTYTSNHVCICVIGE
ncbi:innexin unc-9 isoform X1 [Biomphalaria pfeifferi]|uniref:Innexin unc-9 isoform X1 n=1 Tax=Biomphalaria pfeifferi TaxID=112525 RepID=A0AAD8C6B8_BIOPF|nr:innexin unc-9 isoform X1 [Biomphalaria pfeifferi]